MFKKIKKAQNMMEYTLLLTALTLAFIYAAQTIFKKKAEDTATTAERIIDHSLDQLENAIGVETQQQGG